MDKQQIQIYLFLITLALPLTLSATGVSVTGTGITFADGTVQTTAASSSQLCTPIGQTNSQILLETAGVYCLTGNIVSTLGVDAILIAADNVTLNLNGFHIDGSNNPTNTTTRGITCDNANNVVIYNGKISGYQRGVYAFTCNQISISHMQLFGHYSRGIHLSLSPGSSIFDNNVFNIGLSTGINTKGIYLSSSDGSQVLNNFVHNMTGAANLQGIAVGFSNQVIIEGNQLSTMSVTSGSEIAISYIGNNGIVRKNNISSLTSPEPDEAIVVNILNNATAICRDNIAIGFTTAVNSQCTDSGGNFPP